ncbi:hypothetical protein ABKV19_016280 [Rosa sericea]
MNGKMSSSSASEGVSIVLTCHDSVADPAALKSNCLIVQLIFLQRCILMLKTVATLRRECCCSGADVCLECWPLMTTAIKVIDTAL